MTAESRILLERRVLKALCAEMEGTSVRESARATLGSYAWSDAAHQAAFEVLMSFPSQSAAAMREQFPARLTRRGFPDFDFAGFFQASSEVEAAEEWMRQLVDPRADGAAITRPPQAL
jgi:hypothetical protein